MSKHTPEKELAFIQRLGDGDESVIAELYDNYAATLYGVVFQIVNNEDEANDVLQEAFVNIWKYGKKYDRSKGRLFTWMLNIARNKAIDKLRKIKRTNTIQNTEENVYKLENENTTENNVDTIGLRSAVSKLDAEKQQLIELAYFGGYTQQEMADELDLPLGTIKSRVRTALKDLKKIFR